MKKIILEMYICAIMLLCGCAVGETSDNYEAGSTSESTQNVEAATYSQEVETVVKEYAVESDGTLFDPIPNAELDEEGEPEYSAQEIENKEVWEIIFSQDYISNGMEMTVEVWLESGRYSGAKLCFYPSNAPDDVKEVAVPVNEYYISEVMYCGDFILVDRTTGAHEAHSPLVYCEVDGQWVEAFDEKARSYTYELILGDDLQGKVIMEGTEIPFDASAWAQVYQDYGYYADGKKTERAVELEKEIAQRSFMSVDMVTVEDNQLVLSKYVDNYAAWDDLVQLVAYFAYEDGEWVITKVTGTELEYPY